MKLALVGTGYMARKHSTVLRQLAELEWVCSTRRSAERAAAFQSEFGYNRRTQDFDEVLRDPTTEAVFICSPDPTHVEFTLRALEAGKHVFCEKPLAWTCRDFQLLREARDRSQKVLQVGMNCRYREQYSKPQELVHQGRLGDLRFLRGVYLHNAVQAAKRREKPWWREHPSDVYFFLHANGIHCIDLLQWIGGPVASVFARASGFELGDDYKADTFSCSLEYENGCLGEMLVSTSAFQPRDISLQMWLAEGSIVGTTVHQRKGEEVAGSSFELEVVQEVIDLGHQYHSFVQAVDTGHQPLNSLEEAYENFCIIRAVEASIRSGQPVKVDTNW